MPVPHGGRIGSSGLPSRSTTSESDEHAVAGAVVDARAGRCARRTRGSRRRRPRARTGSGGRSRRRPARPGSANRRVCAVAIVGPEHVGEPQQRDGGARRGVGEVADGALDLDDVLLDRRARRVRPLHLLGEVRRVVLLAAVPVRRGLEHDLAHRGLRAAAGGEEVHRPDDVVLVRDAATASWSSRRRAACGPSCRPRSPARCGAGSSAGGRRARTRCARARPWGRGRRRRRSPRPLRSRSSAWATRPPQKVLRPVTRIRREHQPNQIERRLASIP